MSSPAPPTSDPEVVRLDHRGGTLAFTDEGPRDAVAVVAIHGLPGSVRDFRYLGPPLANRVRFVRVELPGFGGSTFDPAALPFAGRAAAVLAVADHLGLDRFVALGHSMGGGTALTLASQHGRRVCGLALVSSVALRTHRGLGAPPRVFRLLAAAHRLPLLGEVLTPISRYQYRRRRFSGLEAMTRHDFARQLDAIAATDFDLLRAAVRGPLPPTLVAYALDDPLVETPVSEELARALPRARVLVFPDGGHNLQKTHAAELAEALVALAAQT